MNPTKFRSARLLLRISTTSALFFALHTAQAQINVCVDARGAKTYTDKTCAAVGATEYRVLTNINPDGKECRELSGRVKTTLDSIQRLNALFPVPQDGTAGYGTRVLGSDLRKQKALYEQKCGRPAPTSQQAGLVQVQHTATSNGASDSKSEPTVHAANSDVNAQRQLTTLPAAQPATPRNSTNGPNTPSIPVPNRGAPPALDLRSLMMQFVFSLFKTYWLWIFAIGLLSVFFAYLKSPAGKGAMWEGIINLAIRISLDKRVYWLLKDVTLPTQDGTTQVDHIIVSKYGVFVVEAKNYGGWIYGDQHQRTWTQSFGHKKFSFQNPLDQNHKHVRTVAEVTGLTRDKIHSLVAFSGNATLKTEMPPHVTQGLGYLRYVKSKTETLLSHDEVLDVIDALNEARLQRSKETNRQHIEHVKSIRAAKLAKAAERSNWPPK
jgi:hypothetical protein